MNGELASFARRRASSVLPTPVGPIMRMFFGITSSAISGGSFCRRSRLRSAMATARLASGCPMTYLSSSRTISRGVSSSRTGRFFDGLRRADRSPFRPVPRKSRCRWYRCRFCPRSSWLLRRSAARESFVCRISAVAAESANGPPEPMAATSSSGSITSPLPLRMKVFFASATSSSASRCRRILSVRQSLASSTTERGRLPLNCSSLASKRANSEKASAVEPANPATILSL